MRATLAIAVVLLGVTACHRNEPAKVVRVAVQPAPLFASILVAKQKGWLEEELKPTGVAVKWTSFPAGPPMNESFAAGEQDIGVMGDSPAIIARSAGQDTRVVGMSATGPHMLAVVVPKDSTLQSPAELKGKRVAVVKGSYAHHLLALVLEGAHLGLGDVALVNLAHADIGPALQKGDIDAGAIWEPQLTNLTADGVARVLRDGTGIKKGALVIVSTRAFASKNPALVRAFLGVCRRAHELIQARPAEAAEALSHEINLPPERLRAILAHGDFDPGLHPDDIEEIKSSEAFMRANGIIKEAVDIDAFIDGSYALAAGGR